MTRILKAIDLYCGAGGTTTGAEMSGRVKVVVAINHWKAAIYTHQDNYPDTKHIHAPIDHVDPRDFAGDGIDLIFASPECTHHSNARGGRPMEDQKRAGGWDVLKWVETLRPTWLVVENVREWLDWGPLGVDGRPLKSKKGETFKAWVSALQSFGYRVEWNLLNAADFGEATSRVRLFVIARKANRKIPWPEPTHAKIENGKPRWRSAAEIINWSQESPSIFTRKRPLADKTLRRIEIGIRKFCSPFLVKYRGKSHTGSIDRPAPTMIASHHPGHLVVPFCMSSKSGGVPRSIGSPVPTFTTLGSVLLATPYMIDVNHGGDGHRGSRCYAIDRPLGTLTTKRSKAVCAPFIASYYGTNNVHPVSNPLATVTAKHRHGLVEPTISNGVRGRMMLRLLLQLGDHSQAMRSLLNTMWDHGVVDVGFRMLGIDELARAQGFPEDYKLFGTKTDQTRMIGNSVCPGISKAICEAITV